MNAKATRARNGAGGMSRKKKAELVNVALGRAALGTACRVLQSLANAKEFETAGNPVPFRAHAEKYTQEMRNCPGTPKNRKYHLTKSNHKTAS